LRGCATNGGGFVLLALIGWGLGLWTYVVIAMAIQLAVYALHGWPNKSEEFYDLSGSLTHLAVVVASALGDGRSKRQVFTAVAAVIWMTRLGTFLYIRIAKDGKDERFDPLKKHWWSFLGAWTLQATWVVLTELPIILINTRTDAGGCNIIDYLCMILWAAGFCFEVLADMQKMMFRLNPENKGKYITTGVWAVSRHPNYFGEILMWASLALMVSFYGILSGQYSLLAAWISPAFTALLLLKVSGVPMVERAGEKKWGND
jgi:steroid 5-alpha reductase family enzyme